MSASIRVTSKDTRRSQIKLREQNSEALRSVVILNIQRY